MRPEIVTFWHGPLDALETAVPEIAGRGRPQGHRLQFRAAGAIARRRRQCRGRSDPAARLRRKAAPDRPRRRVARLDHLAVQRFLPDAADGARMPACGSTPTCCCSSRSRSIRQNPISPGSGRASSAIPCSICRPDDPIVAAFAALMQQDELTPDWLALRHRLTFALRKLRGSQPALRYSRRDLRSRRR